jgi:hypothetical protein
MELLAWKRMIWVCRYSASGACRALALGRAVFIFTKLEWSAINCCERMVPNSFHALRFREKTARNLAKKLVHLAAILPPSLREELCVAAAEFDELRKTRNKLLHAWAVAARYRETTVRHYGLWKHLG